MRTTLAPYEQETLVSYSRANNTMHIYTADATMMRKFDALEAYRKTREHKQEGRTIAAEYEADKALVTFRSKRKTVKPLSEEEKQARRERLRKNREATPEKRVN